MFTSSIIIIHLSSFYLFLFFWHMNSILCVKVYISNYFVYRVFSPVKRNQKNACILNSIWDCCLISVELKSGLCVCSLMSEPWVSCSLCFDSLNHNSGRSISRAVRSPPSCHIRPNRTGFLLKGRNIITIPLFCCCKHPFPTHSPLKLFSRFPLSTCPPHIPEFICRNPSARFP